MSKEYSYLTVTSLNSKIRNLIEGSLDSLWVKGEISNYHLHPSSGHMYFTLKDNSGEIRCVMFRGNNNRIKFKPENGFQVRLFGSVTIYEQRGQIQLKVATMDPEGAGDLFLAFELLKKNLLDEGLFNDHFKKEIPKYPKTIGIVTSGSSAAFQDIINIIKRRAPQLNIILCSVIVQGSSGAESIVQGIQDLNTFSEIDVIILGRGGGSIEDLWCFNEEIVARSIFSSVIPIISAVGHETDFTISDFVSDLRAPTPSAAAEIVSLTKEEVLASLKNFRLILFQSLKKTIEKEMLKIDYLENRVRYQQPVKQILVQKDKIFELRNRLIKYIQFENKNKNQKIASIYKQLVGLSPKKVINRGYSIVYSNSNKIIRNSSDVEIGDRLTVQTGNGSLVAEKIE